MGADQVIPEEFETAIEMFERILKKLLVPKSEIEGAISHIRDDNYGIFMEKAENNTYALSDENTRNRDCCIESWRLRYVSRKFAERKFICERSLALRLWLPKEESRFMRILAPDLFSTPATSFTFWVSPKKIALLTHNGN